MSDDLPWYEDIGREPWPDEKVEEAIAAWRADHPDASEATAYGIAKLARERNEKAKEQAKERAAMEAAGVERLDLWRQAKAEAAERGRRQRVAEDLEQTVCLIAQSLANNPRDRQASRRCLT